MPSKCISQTEKRALNLIGPLSEKRRPKVLHKEYASFRNDIVQFFVKEVLPRAKTIVDPMAGTAPLIPFVELLGLKAYFNDILPIHVYINKAKTYQVFNALQSFAKKDPNFLKKELRNCFSTVKNHRLRISDKWIPDDIVEGMLSVWAKTHFYEKPIRDFFRAVIILSARYFGTFSQSLKNTTWYTPGGMSSEKDITQIIEEIIIRYQNYFGTYYKDRQDVKGGLIYFSSEDAAKTRIKWKNSVILTSPAFPNRFNYIRMYAPELYFLSFVDDSIDFENLESNILASNIVKKYQSLEKDFDLLLKAAPKTTEFLRGVESKERKGKGKKSENKYYYRYFLRYYKNLFSIIDNLLKSLGNSACIYLVLQSNIHRGELNDIEAHIREYCTLKGYSAETVIDMRRPHQGRRNISADHPLVIKKHQESIVKVTKCK